MEKHFTKQVAYCLHKAKYQESQGNAEELCLAKGNMARESLSYSQMDWVGNNEVTLIS